jgi:Transducer of regulated CREB activity, N terminus
MANPRKFAEKIALMNQKEAEQNAAYQQIMADVTPITRVSRIRTRVGTQLGR